MASTVVQPTLYKDINLSEAEPILKWAGGKRQLLPEISKRYPDALRCGKITTYIEPFVGGGAVFFDVIKRFPLLECAYLIDVNKELIMLYEVIKRSVHALITRLEVFQTDYLKLDEAERSEFYYQVREIYNAEKDKVMSSEYNETWIARAAQTIFLNKTCFNGLFRVNSKGKFNVPFGRYKNPSILQERRLLAVHEALQITEIIYGDFSQVEILANKNSFIYYDPPYRPISTTASFTAYASDNFDDNAQRRLANLFRRLDAQGVSQLLSNSDPMNLANDTFFDELYKGYRIERVEATRMINSVASKRQGVSEIIVRNYRL